MANTNIEPTTIWHMALPLDELPLGPALTPELLDVEATRGITRDVLWAYADSMPELLGDAIMEAVHPLGFGRGALVAIATEVPVDLPHIRFVQTSSEAVCQQMGGRVPVFYVRGRACLEALIQSGSAVERVHVRSCDEYEVDAPFEVVFGGLGDDAPTWWLGSLPEHLLQIAQLDVDVWVCWDRDLKKAVVYVNDQTFDLRCGPRGVAPEENPPIWASANAFALSGSGWASTCIRRRDGRDTSSVTATLDRRWLLLHSFPSQKHDDLICAWKEGRDMRPLLDKSSDFVVCADLQLLEYSAIFRWVGIHRVLRLRDGRIEQLTTDHDIRWYLAEQSEEVLPVLEEHIKRHANIVFTSVATHELTEGTCDVREGDRFILLNARIHQKLIELEGEGLGERLSRGSVRDAARWAMETLRNYNRPLLRPIVFVDADATVSIRWRDVQEHNSQDLRAEGMLALPEPDGVDVLHFDAPRPIAGERISLARKNVPLVTEVTITRHLQGWRFNDRWLARVAGCPLLSTPDFPDTCLVRMVFMVDAFHQLEIFSWELLNKPSPLVPRPATATSPGKKGALVDMTGFLAPFKDEWPQLDDAISVVLPSVGGNVDRDVLPDPRLQQEIEQLLGGGELVRIIGEVGPGSRTLYALFIEGVRGSIKLP